MEKFNNEYNEVYNMYNDDLEVLRKKEKARFILIFVLVLIFFSTLIISNNMYSISVILVIIVLVILNRKIIFSRSMYYILFKEKIIRRIINLVNDKLDYYPEKSITVDLYSRSLFSDNFTDFFSNDLILSKENNIVMSDLVLTRVEGSGKKRRTVTVFEGMFLKLELDFNINSNVRVLLDKCMYDIYIKEKKIDIDSSEFEEKFNIYTNNRMIAMQIFTSDVMAEIIEYMIKNELEFEVSIVNNELFIKYNTGNMFEPNVFKKNLDKELLYFYYVKLEKVLYVSDMIKKIVNNLEG